MFDLFKSIFQNDAYENLDAREFLVKAKATPGAVLLDVRTAAELNAGMIESAEHLDIYRPDFKERISEMDREKSYFIYCRSGQRSAQACRIMHDMGFKNLFNMAGGVLAL